MKNNVKSYIEPVKPESFYINLDCKIQSFCAYRKDFQVFPPEELPRLKIWCKYCDRLITSTNTDCFASSIIPITHQCPILGYCEYSLKWK